MIFAPMVLVSEQSGCPKSGHFYHYPSHPPFEALGWIEMGGAKNCVFPVEPQRPNGKNINLHKKWGFRRFQKECRKVPKSAENRTFCAFFVHFLRKKCGSPLFSALFGTLSGKSSETPLFVQINVFAVWPLRPDRKYTILGIEH